jgi:hypothetical protein
LGVIGTGAEEPCLRHFYLESGYVSGLLHCGDQLIFRWGKGPFKTGDFTNFCFSVKENEVTKEAPLFVSFPVEKKGLL